MDKMIMILKLYNYKYISEYENLSDEEKVYMDYVDMCLNDPNEKFCDACSCLFKSYAFNIKNYK